MVNKRHVAFQNVDKLRKPSSDVSVVFSRIRHAGVPAMFGSVRFCARSFEGAELVHVEGVPSHRYGFGENNVFPVNAGPLLKRSWRGWETVAL